MSRTLRRLVAGALVAGSLLAVAPQAQASVYCRTIVIGNDYFRVCL